VIPHRTAITQVPARPCQQSLAKGRSGVLRTFCLWPRNTSHASFFEVYIFYSIEKKLSCLVYLGRLILFFSCGAMDKLTQTKSACTAYVRPIFFAGGKRMPAMPVVRARLIPRRLPPQTPVRLLGLASTHRYISCCKLIKL
jgi:hypothetical protein